MYQVKTDEQAQQQVEAVGLAGCTSDSEPDPKPEPTGPTPVTINVFLGDDVTAPQRQAIEVRLYEVPGASEITFETREQSYERFKEVFKDDPEMLEQVTSKSLPESPPSTR